MKTNQLNVTKFDTFTCKNYQFGKARTPRRITLLGDKTKQTESSQHIIEFPGGAVEVSRTTEGNYWVHVIINEAGYVDPDMEGLHHTRSEIIGGRIDTDQGVMGIPGYEKIEQIALLIKNSK